MDGCVDDFLKKGRIVAEKIGEFANGGESFVIVGDRDADGQTSTAIMSAVLETLNADYTVHFTDRSRDDFESVLDEFGRDYVYIFTDVGSGQSDQLISIGYPDDSTIIIDHHTPKTRFFKFELNPLHFGIDGAVEVSGAGVSYIVARNFGLYKLSALAIVGATGDMQNTLEGFTGLNRSIIIPDLVNYGVADVFETVKVFGRETKPLFVEMMYLSEPKLFNDFDDAKHFLASIGLGEFMKEPLNRVYDLAIGEESVYRRLLTGLYNRFMRIAPLFLRGYFSFILKDDGIRLRPAPEGTEVKDVVEFSTLLNSANRLNRLEVTRRMLLDFALSDDTWESGYLSDAIRIRREMSRTLAKVIRKIENDLENRVFEWDFLVVLDLTGIAPPNTTGTIAQMLMHLINPDYDKPVLSYTYSAGGVIKFSMREPRILFIRGLNLADAVSEAVTKFGGVGGGHAPACGGFITDDAFSDFLRELERVLVRQAYEKGIFLPSY